MTFTWWQLLLMLGATIRLTRLVVDDTLLTPFREWVEHKEVPPGGFIPPVSFTTLINCTWCTGMWVAGIVIGLSVAWSGMYWVWGIASLAYLVGLEAVLRERVEVR